MRLIEAKDKHFSWMLGNRSFIVGLRLPPGGMGERAMLEMLRAEAVKLRKRGCRAYWVGVVGREIVGLCGYKRLPDETGTVDFGYGIADSRQGCGHGTAMVAALVEKARRDRTVKALIAETAVNNLASQRVLARNGFVRVDGRLDPDDGLLIVWRRDVVRRGPFWPKPKRNPAPDEPARGS
jgi:RimJ/RimL family protein N-acetyltransferase